METFTTNHKYLGKNLLGKVNANVAPYCLRIIKKIQNYLKKTKILTLIGCKNLKKVHISLWTLQSYNSEKNSNRFKQPSNYKEV